MNVKQKRFCAEYLVDLNATQAAIRAGYSPASAGSIGYELLKKPDIRARIDKGIAEQELFGDRFFAEQERRTGINADRVLRELGRIAFVSAPDLVNMDDATLKEGASADDLAAIASVKVKTIPGPMGDGFEREIRLADKLKALELIGKHLGMFTDKVELNAVEAVQIVDDIPDRQDDQP